MFNNRDSENIKELWADFMECIKTGNRPVCDIEIGQQATNMSLLGVLSAKLGRTLEWDGENCKVIGDDEANAMLKRDYRDPWVYPTV